MQFLLKMAHIRERRLSRVPVILEGETGVGKTKLLQMYTELEAIKINSNFRVHEMFVKTVDAVLRPHCPAFCVAKIDEELKEHSPPDVARLCRFLLTAIHEARSKSQELLATLMNSLRGVFEGVLINHPFCNISQLQFWFDMLLPDPEQETMRGSSSKVKFENFVKQPLSVSIAMLKRAWQAEVTSSDFSDIDDISMIRQKIGLYGAFIVQKVCAGVSSSSASSRNGNNEPSSDELLCRWLVVWLMAEPVNSLHTILMHATYTVSDLRRDVAVVKNRASRAKAAYSQEGRANAIANAQRLGCTTG